MLRFIVGVVVGLWIAHLWPQAFGAEISACGPWEEVRDELRQQGEVPVAVWVEEVEGDQGVVKMPKVLFASAERDTWTLVMGDVGAGGYGCTVRNGEGVRVLGIGANPDPR